MVSGMFCWCGLRGTCRLSMRRPSFPVRGMTTRLTAPAMAIRSWWTLVLLLWPSRNCEHLYPRRAAENCNCKTFLSTEDTEGHGELQLQNVNGNFFLSTKGREGPRRRSRATAGKATAERQLQGFFLFCAGRRVAAAIGVLSGPQQTKKIAVGVAVLPLPFCSCSS